MSKLSANIIDRILPDYFNNTQLEEFNKVISKTLPPHSIIKLSDNLTIKEQLDLDLLLSNDYSQYIDLLITFTLKNLEFSKSVEFLLLLGDNSITQGELTTASRIYNHTLSIVNHNSNLENISAYCHLSLGEISSREANWNEAISYIKTAQKLFNKHKDLKGSAKCSNLLGTIYGDRGNLRKAKINFENSLSLLEPKTDTSLIGMLEVNLGIIYNIQGNYDEALSYYQRALIKYEQLRDQKRISEIKHNLGMLYLQKGEYDKAIIEFDSSIRIALEIGNLPTLSLSYLNKAYIYSQINDFDLSAAFAEKSMEICFSLNDRLSIADLYKIKGIIEQHKKNYLISENYFLTSIRINEELENIMNAEKEKLKTMNLAN